MHSWRFDPRDTAVDMSGKVCAVTGATSGLGYATAHALAARGAEVHLLYRDVPRGAAVRDRLAAATRNPAVVLHEVEVADLASIRRFAERFEPRTLDVLVHNAGCSPTGAS